MTDRAVPVRPRWETAVLVCKACGKRARAPKDAKPKALVVALRRLTKGSVRRSRIVLTGCLGLCPKRATAVAVVGGVGGARIVPIGTRADLSALGALFVEPATREPDRPTVAAPATAVTAATTLAIRAVPPHARAS